VACGFSCPWRSGCSSSAAPSSSEVGSSRSGGPPLDHRISRQVRAAELRTSRQHPFPDETTRAHELSTAGSPMAAPRRFGPIQPSRIGRYDRPVGRRSCRDSTSGDVQGCVLSAASVAAHPSFRRLGSRARLRHAGEPLCHRDRVDLFDLARPGSR
jgi:hypothetical protein